MKRRAKSSPKKPRREPTLHDVLGAVYDVEAKIGGEGLPDLSPIESRLDEVARELAQVNRRLDAVLAGVARLVRSLDA